jgi:cell wall-associated NlpC family hydrolase
VTPGGAVLPVHRRALLVLWAHMAGRVVYQMGAKAPSLDCDSAEIDEIDCSGFVRYAIARATAGRLIIPDGSAPQLQWCLDEGLERQVYGAAGSEGDGVLRINFLTEARAAEVGRPGDRHVWFTFNGRTMESHGEYAGHSGCVSRDAGIWILRQCDFSFVLPSVPV